MDYQDLDSDDETPATNTNLVTSSTPKNDYDNFDDLSDKEVNKVNGNESDSDEGVGQNPLVIAPVDLESSEDEKESKIESIKSDLDVAETVDDKEDQIEIAAETKEDIGQEITPLDKSSDDEDKEAGNRYEVTADFDLDEPELDDWLGGGGGNGNKKKKETAKVTFYILCD